MTPYWSLNCRSCFHCKKKKIKSFSEMVEFGNNKENDIRKSWEEKFNELGYIEFFWCSIEDPQKLRINPPGTGKIRESGKFCECIDN